MRSSPWTVVLAAGAGTRLASLTGGVPKQYWRRDGSPTLLEDTLARLRPLSSDSRTVVVADISHRAYFDADWWPRQRADVLYQPLNRGTAAGVIFPLTWVLDRDPDSTVVFTPADHGVDDLDAFHVGLERAMAHAARHDEVVLLAVEADQPAEDYGWIVPTKGHRTGIARVRSFVEKPARPHAEALLREGGAWNTMVTVARARVLADLFRTHMPELTHAFSALRARHGARWYGHLNDVYATLPSRDFSRDLMERARNLATYVWPATMGWSDLGTPDRLCGWGRRPRLAPRVAVA